MWGTLHDLRADASIGAAQCGWDDHVGATLLDSPMPPPRVGYYYVVRGDAPRLSAGTLDNVPGLNPPEGRDQQMATGGGQACGDLP